MTRRVPVVVIVLLGLQGCSGAPASETPTNEAPAFTQGAQRQPAAIPSSETPAPKQDTVPTDGVVPPPVADLPPENMSGDPDAGAMPFPEEVTDFMVTRDGCDHFRGEEPYDAERRAYLEENVRQLCTGTDAKLADLLRRYRGDRDVIAALNSYEKGIETPLQP